MDGFMWFTLVLALLIFSHFPIQSRPFGVALLFGGVDETGPALYDMDTVPLDTMTMTTTMID